MRSILLSLLLPSIAFAGIPAEVDDDRPARTSINALPAPCLDTQRERGFVVTWWIEDRATGTRRAAGSQEVRLRC